MGDQSRGEYHDRKVAETEIRPGKYVIIIELPFRGGDKKKIVETITVFEGWSRDQVEKSVKNTVGCIGLHNFGLKIDESGTAEIKVSLVDFKTYNSEGENQAISSFIYRVDGEGHAK